MVVMSVVVMRNLHHYYYYYRRFVWEVVQEEEEEVEAEELDPRTLGVPGLKTLILGDRVEVLWRHGASRSLC